MVEVATLGLIARVDPESIPASEIVAVVMSIEPLPTAIVPAEVLLKAVPAFAVNELLPVLTAPETLMAPLDISATELPVPVPVTVEETAIDPALETFSDALVSATAR
jgi:hypothetical protein